MHYEIGSVLIDLNPDRKGGNGMNKNEIPLIEEIKYKLK
jgi:hypothetical protein